jgi:hypothetical protein
MNLSNMSEQIDGILEHQHSEDRIGEIRQSLGQMVLVSRQAMKSSFIALSDI